jgi:hypothetical protein
MNKILNHSNSFPIPPSNSLTVTLSYSPISFTAFKGTVLAKVSLPKFCIHSLSQPPCRLLILLSPMHYMVTCFTHEVPHHALPNVTTCRVLLQQDDSRSASKNILHLLLNLMVHYRVHNVP